MKISVCIPMYNENRIIAASAKTLSDYMAANFADYEIVFCSDGSTDGCDKTVEALNLPNVRVIAYEKNQGKGCAVRTAMLAATGDVRMFTEADLAYGTDVIKKVADAFEANPDADLVIGSRNLDKSGYEGYTLLRKIISKIYIKVLCIIGGLKLSDSQCGCKAFRNAMGKKIFSHCEVDRFAFDFEAILIGTKFKSKIIEIPVKIIQNSESSMHIVSDSIKMLKDIIAMKKRIRRIEE